jgi:hypothetical protein
VISLQQYAGLWAGHEDWNPECQREATILLNKVNQLLANYEAETGNTVAINQFTKSQISGAKYGGFRTQDCPIGAPRSSHKIGMAVDILDRNDALDDWITAHPEVLVEYNLYREHPDDTKSWCHLSTKPPKSGNRTFKP